MPQSRATRGARMHPSVFPVCTESWVSSPARCSTRSLWCAAPSSASASASALSSPAHPRVFTSAHSVPLLSILNVIQVCEALQQARLFFQGSVTLRVSFSALPRSTPAFLTSFFRRRRHVLFLSGFSHCAALYLQLYLLRPCLQVSFI